MQLPYHKLLVFFEVEAKYCLYDIELLGEPRVFLSISHKAGPNLRVEDGLEVKVGNPIGIFGNMVRVGARSAKAVDCRRK